MLKRNISTIELELILTETDGTIKQSRDKFIYYKKIKRPNDNSITAVTLLKSKNEFEIITVMIDFEIQ